MAGSYETKIIYYLDDEDTPYSVKLSIPLEAVKLKDFKSILALPKTNYKFFFKSSDDDFGIVKEEVVNDDAKLPTFKGRIVSYIVTAEGSNLSDGSTSQVTEVSNQANGHRLHANPHNRPLRQPFSYQDRRGFRSGYDESCDGSTTCTETDSIVSSRCRRFGTGRCRKFCDCEGSSVFTSDVDSTSFADSDDDDDDDDDLDESASRISSTTADTSVSRIQYRRRRRRRMPAMSDTSSVSSASDTTVSMNVVNVTLTLDMSSFLGITLIGQPNRGIFVGNVMPGGAIAQDGRIERGDMILQVNDINLERKSNDDAVKVLKEAAQKPGPIRLVVLKCWDSSPRGAFTLPRSEPVRPIDPGAWVAHAEAAQAEAEYAHRPGSSATLHSNGSTVTSIADSDRLLTANDALLNVETMDMLTIAKTMASFDSGLDIREREFLKQKIPDAFYGSGVVEWLCTHVQGFVDRKEAKKYASQMLKLGYLKVVFNSSFSEQSFYQFGDVITNCINGMSRLHLGHHMGQDFDGLNDRESLLSKGSGSTHGSSWHQVAPPPAPFGRGANPGFTPWGSDAVHYGVFGPPANGPRSMHSDNLLNASSRQSGSSSSEGERHSQLSGPLPVSSFKPFGLSHSSYPHNNNQQHQLYNPAANHQYAEPTYTISNGSPSEKSSVRVNGCEVSNLSTPSKGRFGSTSIENHLKGLDEVLD